MKNKDPFSQMTVYGVKISSAVQKEAFERWEPKNGYTNLAAKILEVKPLGDHGLHVALRAADRLLQKCRRYGLIEHVGGGKWRAVS